MLRVYQFTENWLSTAGGSLPFFAFWGGGAHLGLDGDRNSVVVQFNPSSFAHGRPSVLCRPGKLPRAPEKPGRPRVVVGLVLAGRLAFAWVGRRRAMWLEYGLSGIVWARAAAAKAVGGYIFIYRRGRDAWVEAMRAKGSAAWLWICTDMGWRMAYGWAWTKEKDLMVGQIGFLWGGYGWMGLCKIGWMGLGGDILDHFFKFELLAG